MALRAFKAARRGAKAILLILLNSFVLFALLNVAIALYANWRAPHKATVAELRREAGDAAIAKFGIDYFKRIYSNKSEAEIRQLIADQAELPPAIYEPYAEYRDPPLTSPTLNIHEAGFRTVGADQGPWPLDPNALNVFVFGGSEVLGSGIADDATIPAAIQKLLRERSGKASVNVYNFAVQAYNSSQDVTYFQNQLRYGNIPDIAIFMEGPVDFEHWNGDTSVSGIYRNYLNTFYQLNSELDRDKGFGWHLKELIRSLPIETFIRQHYNQTNKQTALGPKAGPQTAQQLLHSLGAKAEAFAHNSLATTAAADEPASSDEIYAREYTDGPKVTSPEHIDRAIAGLVTNQAIEEGVSRQFNVEPLTVWLPTPLYKYDLNYMPSHMIEIVRRSRYGYPILAQYIQRHEMGSNFLWCADIQQGLHEQLYVDQAHYNEAGSLLIARCVVDGLARSGEIDRAWRRKSEHKETLLQILKDLTPQNVGSTTSLQ